MKLKVLRTEKMESKIIGSVSNNTRRESFIYFYSVFLDDEFIGTLSVGEEHIGFDDNDVLTPCKANEIFKYLKKHIEKIRYIDRQKTLKLPTYIFFGC